jgi:hypothetical protein
MSFFELLILHSLIYHLCYIYSYIFCPCMIFIILYIYSSRDFNLDYFILVLKPRVHISTEFLILLLCILINLSVFRLKLYLIIWLLPYLMIGFSLYHIFRLPITPNPFRWCIPSWERPISLFYRRSSWLVYFCPWHIYTPFSGILFQRWW